MSPVAFAQEFTRQIEREAVKRKVLWEILSISAPAAEITVRSEHFTQKFVILSSFDQDSGAGNA